MVCRSLKTFLQRYLAHYQGLSRRANQAIITYCFESIAIGLAFYLSIYLVLEKHFDVTHTGFVLSAYGVGTMLGGVFGGFLVDRTRSDWVVLASLIIECVIFFFYPGLNSLTAIIAVTFLLGFSAYTFKTANSLRAIQSVQHLESIQRLKVINSLATASNLGLGISASAIGLLASKGFYPLFIAASVLTLLLALVQCFFAGTDVSCSVNSKSKTNTQSTIAKEKRKKILMLTLFCVFVVGLIIAQRRTTYSIYIHDVFPSYGLHGIGLLYAINPVMIIFLQNPIVMNLKKYNNVIIMGLGALMMGVGMMLLSDINWFYLAVFACVLYTVGEMLFFSVAQFLCYESSAPNKKGAKFGLFQSVYALSMVLGPTIGASIYHHIGAAVLWLLCGVMGLIMLLACLFVAKA